MHSVTFVSVFVALFALLSVAHPIRHLGHGHRILKVRENKRAGNPLVVSSINADLPASASTPVSNGVPSDIPKSDAESSIPIVKSSATSTKSDDQDSKPTQSPSTDGDGSLTHKLFPYGFGEKAWTTAEGVDGARPLSDATLKPTNVLSALSRDIVKAPDGKLGMEAHYPQGSYTFGHDPLGGFSFYAKGPSDVDLSIALEATFGYSVFFEEDFDYQLGGKLLGFCE